MSLSKYENTIRIHTKMIYKKIVLFLLCCAVCFGQSGKELAIKLKINAASKASNQWIKIFENSSKQEKFGIHKLAEDDKNKLKIYLIDHAADSDMPEMAGI